MAETGQEEEKSIVRNKSKVAPYPPSYLKEFRDDMSRAFDEMLLRMAGKTEGTHSQNNNIDARTGDFEEKGGVELEREIIELGHPTDSGLGLAEHGNAPAPVLKTNAKPHGA